VVRQCGGYRWRFAERVMDAAEIKPGEPFTSSDAHLPSQSRRTTWYAVSGATRIESIGLAGISENVRLHCLHRFR